MWLPSTSASVMMMTLWYRALPIWNSSVPMPVPRAEMMVAISSWASILSIRAFSTFRILPRSGRIACVRRSRPCLALPPAESPSTRNTSDSAGSRSAQSASLPGRLPDASAPFRRTRSRALRAASRAVIACTAFRMIFLAVGGFSSRYCPSISFVTVSTKVPTSLFESFVFVCPSNCGSRTRTDSTAVIPSRRSSPDGGVSPFRRPCFFA